MKAISTITLLVILFLIPFTSQSRHIVGGTFAYNVVNVTNGIATIDINLYLYRDDNGGAQFDQNINVGLYKYLNAEYQFVSAHSIQLTTMSAIAIDDEALCPNNMINYELGTYSFQIEAPLDNFEHYKISYQRCCRDIKISNIKFPEETGMAISLDLYPEAFNFLNQSFTMKNSFPALVKVGEKTNFDFSVADDFDKNYYLSTPKSAGGVLGATVAGDPFDCQGITPDPENCQPEFTDVVYVNPDFPFGVGADLDLENTTGEMSIEIPEVSNVLIGITLDRSVGAQLMSRIRQQFVINSLNCTISNTSDNSKIEFYIWPSPSNGIIYFNTQLQEISIQNVFGAYQTFNQNNKISTSLDLNHLATGLYFLRGKTTDGQWVSQKFIIVN